MRRSPLNQVQAVHAAPQRAAVYAQFTRRFGAVAVAFCEGIQDFFPVRVGVRRRSVLSRPRTLRCVVTLVANVKG